MCMHRCLADNSWQLKHLTARAQGKVVGTGRPACVIIVPLLLVVSYLGSSLASASASAEPCSSNSGRRPLNNAAFVMPTPRTLRLTCHRQACTRRQVVTQKNLGLFSRASTHVLRNRVAVFRKESRQAVFEGPTPPGSSTRIPFRLPAQRTQARRAGPAHARSAHARTHAPLPPWRGPAGAPTTPHRRASHLASNKAAAFKLTSERACAQPAHGVALAAPLLLLMPW